MDELQRNLEKQQQHFFATSVHSKTITDSMKKYSETSSCYNSRIPLGDCMQRASEWQSTLGDVFNHLGNVLYDRTTQPLKETIRIQLEMIKDGKKKLKKLNPEADRSRTDFKKDQETYDRVGKETLQLYNDSELALENSAVQTVLSAYEAYYDFFQKGAFQMARVKVDIDNYRKIILETNKVAAKLRNYIPRKTFGIKLEEVFAREANRPIPMFLEEIFKYLEKTAPTVEGVFRISAGKSAIEALQQKIETSQPLELSTIVDPHVVSSVLKSFFRSLPEPLIFYTSYQRYLPLSSQPQNQHIPELKRLISSLPVCNQIVLRNVLALCSLVKQHKDVTKMDLTNLAVVIGPNLMESIPNLKAEDIQKAETFAEFNALFILLVENHQFIFPSFSHDFANRARAQTESAIPISPGNKLVAEKPLPQLPPSHKPPPPLSASVEIPLSFSSDSLSAPPSSSSPNQKDPVKALKKKSVLIKRSDSELLKPIDMQIYFMSIQGNLGRLKTAVEGTKSTEQGINLIKIFKKVSEYAIPIQKLTKFSFSREKPVVNESDDKIQKLQKTLIYTYENNMDLVNDAKQHYESLEDID
eukprot:gene11923-13891_t